MGTRAFSGRHTRATAVGSMDEFMKLTVLVEPRGGDEGGERDSTPAPPSTALVKQQIIDGLSDFGRSSSGTAFGYLSFAAVDAGLLSVEELSKYHLLQTVDIHGNGLSDLSALGSMPDLCNVNASANKLTKLLDFTAPRNLRSVDVAQNEIAEIGDQTANRFLQRLVLDSNQIQVIAGLHNCKQLVELCISNNNLTTISGLEGLPLKTLRLDNNNLTEIGGFETLSSLQYLDLSGNEISSLDGLQHLVQLKALRLSSNQIAAADETQYLCELSYLTELDLVDNPVQLISDYRLALIFRLQRLLTLDGEPISPEEKVAAVDLFEPALDVVAAIIHAMHTAKRVFGQAELKPSTTTMAEHSYPCLVLAGPSGSGRRLIRKRLIEENLMFAACPSHTTRPQEDEEISGSDYIFCTNSEFRDLVEQGAFLQTSQINGNNYGVSQLVIEKIASDKQIPVISLEIEGVRTLKKTSLKPTFVYCRPPADVAEDDVARVDIYERYAKVPGFFNDTVEGPTFEDLYSCVVPTISERLVKAQRAVWNEEERRFN